MDNKPRRKKAIKAKIETKQVFLQVGFVHANVSNYVLESLRLAEVR
jgi:hypothetical protein